MAAAAKSTAVELPPMNIQTIDIPIIGDAGLICHAWSAKAKKQMLDKQMKRATGAKEAKDPEADYQTCFYKTEAGGYGFPAIGVKAAMIRILPDLDP